MSMKEDTLPLRLQDKVIPNISCSEAKSIAIRFKIGERGLNLFLLTTHCVRPGVNHSLNCPQRSPLGREVMKLIQDSVHPGFNIKLDPEEMIPDISCAEAIAITEELRTGNRNVDLIVLQAHLGRERIQHNKNCPALSGPNDIIKIIEDVTVV